MRGLKFLFKSWAGMPAFKWIAVIFGAGFAVLPFVFNEAHGSEDYLIPKLFLFFPVLFCAELGLICGCRDICANRLTRSMPIAKELYTRSVPLFVIILTVGISAVMITAYFIYLGVTGAEECQFSDTLICGATVCLPILIFSPLAARIVGGGVLVVYAMAAVIVPVIFIGGSGLSRYGFEAPLWLAAVIFAASLAIGIGFTFWICNNRFKKSNVRIAPTQLSPDNSDS